MLGERARSRGVSLQAVLTLVMVVGFLAVTMTALFMASLNFTQAYNNGELAFSEAEAGVAELMAQVTTDPNYGTSLNEEIRDTLTPGFSPRDAWHVVTFRRGTNLPYSTNNVNGSSNQGDLGRSIPSGRIHAFSTGYCRGQYRTIEVVIEQPPFPFGLATTGKIYSRDPLIVRGASKSGVPGEEDQPGHVISNAPEGVEILRNITDPTKSTLVTGYIKSPGVIKVEQPAVVKLGVRPGSEPQELPKIDLLSFNNQGDPGVVDVVDSVFGSQVLDVMYYSNHPLEYDGPVTMRNGFLYADGDLLINGGISGKGAIVANGNVTINGGAQLSATDHLAVLATGRIDVRGGGNYFGGILYSETELKAKSIVVVGNAIVNSGVNGQGGADLEQVQIVSDETRSTLSFTASSSSDVQTQTDQGRVPFDIAFNGTNVFPAPDPGTDDNPNSTLDDTYASPTITPDMTPEDVTNALNAQMQGLLDHAIAQGVAEASGQPTDGWGARSAQSMNLQGEEAAIYSLFAQLFDMAIQIYCATSYLEGVRRDVQRIQAEIEALNPLPEDDPATPDDEHALAEANLNSLQGQLTARQAEFDRALADQQRMIAEYNLAKDHAICEYLNFFKQHTQADGTYQTPGMNIDVTHEYKFDLNTYIPPADKFRITFWQLYPRKL